MSKLTVANLFRSVRAMDDAHAISPGSAHLIGENLWRLTADAASLQPRIDLAELLSAVHFVFHEHRENGDSGSGDFAAWRSQRAERQLRFDRDHRDDVLAANRREHWVPQPARHALSKGLGAAQARERLGGEEWIVIVVDAQAPSAELPPELLKLLSGQQRILVLWCDEQGDDAGQSEHHSPAASAFEQLSGSPDFVWLGPIGGLEMDGVVAVLEALKTLEKPAALHLRLRSSSRRAHDLERSVPGRNAPASEPQALRETRPPKALELAVERWLRLAGGDRQYVAVNLLSSPASEAAANRLAEAGYPRRQADADAIAWCAGLSDGGCRPFLWLDDVSLRRTWAPLAEMACNPARPVTVIVAAPDAGREAAEEEFEQLRLLPGTALMLPGDAAAVEEMVACAARQESPAAIWLPAALPERTAPADAARVQWGRAAELRRGSDIVLIAAGGGVSLACEAAAELAGQGVGAAVVDVRFVRPLDERHLLDAVREAPAAVLLDDGAGLGEFFADVSAWLQRHASDKPAPVVRALQRGEAGEPSPFDRETVRELAARCRSLVETAGGAKGPAFPAEPSKPAFSTHSAASGEEDERRELEQVQRLQLSPVIQAWINSYAKHGRRDLYLWQWCRQGIELTTLPCVRDELRSHVNDTKLLGVMLDVLLDDVADFYRDPVFLEGLIGLLQEHGDAAKFEGHQREYAQFTVDVWNEIFVRAREYPGFEQFHELLRYDYVQLFNTMRYSSLINRQLTLLNQIEHELYLPHNMHMMIFSTLDLMCTPQLRMQELGRIREAMWHAQCMGQIGNQITTWQRELNEGDYSSGVFVTALASGDVTVDQLHSADRAAIENAVRQGGHEERLFARWRNHRDRLLALASEIESFDVATVVSGLDRLMQIELGSRGRR